MKERFVDHVIANWGPREDADIVAPREGELAKPKAQAKGSSASASGTLSPLALTNSFALSEEVATRGSAYHRRHQCSRFRTFFI